MHFRALGLCLILGVGCSSQPTPFGADGAADLGTAPADGAADDGGSDGSADPDGGKSAGACGRHLPDPLLTPGALCTPNDPNFSGYRYMEHIAICNRNVPSTEKNAIGAAYGVKPADYPLFEFDHYLPLSIGGSDDQTNVWPQDRTEALQKDTLEQHVFDGMNNGTLTQAQAIAMIRAWRPTGVSCP